jgi:hypothetical protein
LPFAPFPLTKNLFSPFVQPGNPGRSRRIRQPKHAASKGIIAAWQQRKQLYYQVPNGPSNAIDEASLLLPLPDDAEQERIEVIYLCKEDSAHPDLHQYIHDYFFCHFL